jgi:hypothetical protein
MANQWLRLWHDMPNDPKFRVVAKASGQPVSLVIAVFFIATSGKPTTPDSIAQRLAADLSCVLSIVDAMQGRLLNGLLGIGIRKKKSRKKFSGKGRLPECVWAEIRSAIFFRDNYQWRANHAN